jgi:hypothetical protein
MGISFFCGAVDLKPTSAPFQQDHFFGFSDFSMNSFRFFAQASAVF